MTQKIVIGALETCHLPELGINNLQIRVDTGAQTSSLHVDNIKSYKNAGKPWVQFDLHPDIYDLDTTVTCKTPVCDIRRVKSSNGTAQKRYVIKTPLALGDAQWDIEITLTDRSDMSYSMLLGREGMAGRVLVDPGANFLVADGD